MAGSIVTIAQSRPSIRHRSCWWRHTSARKEGNFLKAPGADIRQLIHSGGLKPPLEKILLMLLTVASGLILISYWLQLLSLAAVQSTCYNCTHTEENGTMHTGNSKGAVLSKHKDLLCKYKHRFSSYSTNTAHIMQGEETFDSSSTSLISVSPAPKVHLTHQKNLLKTDGGTVGTLYCK